MFLGRYGVGKLKTIKLCGILYCSAPPPLKILQNSYSSNDVSPNKGCASKICAKPLNIVQYLPSIFSYFGNPTLFQLTVVVCKRGIEIMGSVEGLSWMMAAHGVWKVDC